ncbi:PREDICTED: histamine H2 receptor-like [Branchiostoma belcheri]|uniref:Histamine H2 receptor-like n=1 Tax=Branchiostoma belcheri TaxID=7741 RepID=A0A6P4ZKF4_BRABE|nr:PREDICTED: histamine H2 receptor-like [Branchiostoma belcheri]
MAEDYEYYGNTNASFSPWTQANTTSVYDHTTTAGLGNGMDEFNKSFAATVGRSVVLAVVLLLSLVGNVLVCYVFVRKPVILADVGHRFVLNLACCDIGITLLVIPFSLTSSIYNQWVFGPEWCQGQGFIGNLLFCASILTLAVVSVDRFSAILRPLQYNSTFTSRWFGRRHRCSLGDFRMCRFTTAGRVGEVRLSGRQVSLHVILAGRQKHQLCSFPNRSSRGCAYRGNVNCLRVDRTDCLQPQTPTQQVQIQPHSCNKATSGPTYRKQDCKAARTIFCITSGFVVCWVPYLVVTSVELGGLEVPADVETAAVWLRFIACVVNPFIYGYMNRIIRKTVWKLFRRKAVDQGTITTVVGTDDLWNSATAAPAQLTAANTQTSRLSNVNLINDRANADNRTVREQELRRSDTVVRFADEADTIVAAPIEEHSLDREVSDEQRPEDLPGVPLPTPSE